MARQGWDIAGLSDAARRCNELAVLARRAGAPVVWTRMMFEPDYSDGGRLISALRPNLAKVGALKRGSGDEELSQLVEPAPGDTIIDKARFSAHYATPLEALLRARGTNEIFVAGVTTSMCVESTVRDLGQRDYRVRVVEDACADFDTQRHENSIGTMGFGFAEIIDFRSAAEAFERDGRHD